MALPPELAALAAQRRLSTQVTAERTWQLVGGLWRRVSPGDVAGSWQQLGPAVQRLVHAGQLAAAQGAQAYVTAALELQGTHGDAAGTVVTDQFAGIASDGSDLGELLSIPARHAATAVEDGVDGTEALAEGEMRLRRMVRTQVGDAGRVPVGVATVAARKTRKWVRMVTPPACSRCIILAGKVYRDNEGFKRHPNCDCVHVPVAEDVTNDYSTNPVKFFDRLDESEQDKIFTKAGAQAIRDGANIFQVVNARREMRWVSMAGRDLKASGIGTTRASLAGQRLGAGRKRRVIRLMPESIYAIARDRTELLRLLHLHGYLV